jgi:hypothetical protein
LSDPLGKGPVTVELNNTAAQLLASLCVALDTEDPRGSLCFVNERGEQAEVVF